MAETKDVEVPRLPYETGETATAEDLLQFADVDDGDPAPDDSAADDDVLEEIAAAAEASEEEADGDDEGEDVEDGESEADLHRVVVNGEEQDVTYDELVNGYQRRADYTRKTQEVADQRRELDADRAATHEERSALAEVLTAYRAFGAKHLPAEAMKAIEADYQALVSRVKQENDAAFHEGLESEQKHLVERIPEWADAKVAQAEKTALHGYLTNEFGYTARELEGVTDHRLMVLARKAQKYDEMVGEGMNRVRAKTATARTLEPGAKRPPSRPSSAKRAAKAAADRLRQSGSIRDAVDILVNSGMDLG